MEVNERIHGDVTQGDIFKFSKPKYKKRGEYLYCSYCGSLHPEDALKLLQKGVKASGSDWKYGWPHKFYIQAEENGAGKFYSKHLYDANDQTFKVLTDELATKLGIRFLIDKEGLAYKAPYRGFQTWINSGFKEVAPKVPENW